MLKKIMLIEKSRNKEELIINLKLIIEKIKQEEKEGENVEEEKQELLRIIKMILSQRIEKGETEKLVKELEGGLNMRLAVFDMLDREDEKIRKQGEKIGKERGKRENMLAVAKKMLRKNMNIDDIKDITGLSDKVLMKMK